MITRRETLASGALSVIFLGGVTCRCNATTIAPNSAGCILADSDLKSVYSASVDTARYIKGDEPIIGKSGDAAFDYSLAQTLAQISNQFEVLPGFAFYDDSESENAFATPRVRLSNADGTVLMGLGLLRRMMRLPESPAVSVAGVCAHEFGHILQYKHKLLSIVNAGQPSVKRGELQADYYAGYFAGLQKRNRPAYPAAVVALAQFNFGDTQYSDVQHHGTPSERGSAVVRGFEAAFHEKLTLGDSIQQSTNYVLKL